MQYRTLATRLTCEVHNMTFEAKFTLVAALAVIVVTAAAITLKVTGAVAYIITLL